MASSRDEENPSKRDQESDGNQPKLRLCDCKCPICMCVLIEPVRMPCNHELCMPCFRKNVQEANFTCPMCRLRISSWARRQARENKLVDEARWRLIRQAFPDQCRRRLEGEDEDEEEENLDFIPVKRICEPGAIKQEYNEAIEKLRCERQQMEEIEIKKSEEYIAWLQREEVRLYEEQQHELARQQKLDEELAWKMSQGDSPMQEEIRAQMLQQQAAKDEELARKLQKELLQSPGTMPSPLNTTTIVSKKTSRNSSLSSSMSSSSSIKCRRIDTFLSPSSRKTSPRSRSSSKASTVKSTNNSSASPALSISSTSSHRASSGSSLSSLDFDKPSTSCGNTSEPVLIGDPPWGDGSSSDCILEIIADSASPEDMYPSPSSGSGSSKSFKGCLLNSEFDLDTKEDLYEEEGKEEKGTKESAFETVEKKAFEGDMLETKNLRKRSDSMTSTDSISPELNHFRPIDVSPRTSHRRLANGKKESPKIVHTTPRNLTANLVEEGSSVDTSLPPLVKAKFESLIKEKRKKLSESSKATMTGKAAPGGTSTLMQQELKKRLHRKPSANRHTLFNSAANKQTAKPEKSPLADHKTKTTKYFQKQTFKDAIREERTNNSSRTHPKQEVKDTDDDVIMTDADAADPPSADAENGSILEETVSVNGNVVHTKEDRDLELAGLGQNSDKNSKLKRKSTSPQMQSKKQRLEGMSDQVAQEASNDIAKNATDAKRSPGKIYRMKANYPKPKQSSIKQLFTCKDNKADQDHSVSPKRRKVASGDNSKTPPFPALIPSPHMSKLTSDARKPASPLSRKPSENSQENILHVETDRCRQGIITPDKAVLMDTTLGSNQEQNREPNGNLDKVKLGDGISPLERKSISRSPQDTVRTNLTAKAKAKTKNLPPSPPSMTRDPQKAPSKLQKTPSKTRRNTIWKYMELVGEEERRIKQEEEDRKLALRLQEEFDKQERKQTAIVDRTQGSDAAYQLRGRSRTKRMVQEDVDIDSDDDIFS